MTTCRLGVNFVGLISGTVFLLMVYLYVWGVFKDVGDQPKDCVCSCSDETMKSENLVSVVEYAGASINGSCSCEDFLVPAMAGFWMLGSANETCKLCRCTDVTKLDCKDGRISFVSIYIIVSMTLLFVCSLMWCDIAIRNFGRMRRRNNRRKYSQIRSDPLDRVFEYVKTKETTKKAGQKLLEKSDIPNGYQTFYT